MSHRGQKSSSPSLSHSGRRQSLRRRLLALLAAVLLVTLLIIGAGVSYFVFLTEREAWQGRQEEAARNAVQTVVTFIQRIEDSLTLVGLLDRDYLAAEPQVMRDLLQRNPDLLEMVRLDASGKMFASAYLDTPLLVNLFTIPQSTWFLQAAAGEIYLGNVQISPAGDPYLVIAVPAPDGGVVAARLCMNMLRDVVAAIRFGETGQAYVINREGRIVAHSRSEAVMAKTSLAGRPELVALSQSPSHRWNGAYVNLEGTSVVGTAAPVPGTDWVVITELTQSEAFVVSRTALFMLSGDMLLFGVPVMWVTARFLRRLIFQPMERLRAGAERIGQGDLRHRIDIARQDEVGRVAEAFNEMAGRLRDREDQLAVRTTALAAEVAERKRAEEQLQCYAADLEQSNKEVKQFAYIVSHDMRAPLVNLKGFAAELRADLAVIGSAVSTTLPHLDEKRRPAVITALREDVPEALGFIDSSVTRMDHFIKALLKLSRLGRRELDLEPVDMDALVQATLQTLAHQIEERQVKVTVGCLPGVVADRTSMEQIMGNILTNGVKYLDPGRLGEIEITGERDHDATIFHIRDNGRGIAEEDMDKVFAPFRRAGKQDVPGEGMGLAYAQTLVRRHGGRISCESELGVGTTFTFTLSNHLERGGNHV